MIGPGGFMEGPKASGDWSCPWEICTHEQAQTCRAEMRMTKRRRGCGTLFFSDTTADQAKAAVQRQNNKTPNA